MCLQCYSCTHCQLSCWSDDLNLFWFVFCFTFFFTVCLKSVIIPNRMPEYSQYKPYQISVTLPTFHICFTKQNNHALQLCLSLRKHCIEEIEWEENKFVWEHLLITHAASYYIQKMSLDSRNALGYFSSYFWKQKKNKNKKPTQEHSIKTFHYQRCCQHGVISLLRMLLA